MKIAGILIAALFLAPATALFAELPDRAETRRTQFVTQNPDAAADLLAKAPVWPTNKVVVPGNGAESRLVKFLLGTLQPRMPLRAPALAPEKIALVKSWIDRGATEVDFVKDVQPIMKLSCAGCHGPAGHAAGIVVDTYQGFQTSVVGH